MKNITALAAFAAFTVLAMVCSVTVSALAGPEAVVDSITASILVPTVQELPVHMAMD
jgi:hypothetical protein